jgi:predicted N-formylglutamate amidohydrolase
MPQAPFLILTCEHARNKVPSALAKEFRGHAELLKTHRAYDEGALAIARVLRATLKAPLFEGRYSRLVLDLNRSVNHPKAFSEFTRELPARNKAALVEKLHRPFRAEVSKALARAVRSKKTALHFSVHSFTPRLNGETRNCEIGLLYDPHRTLEAKLARALKAKLRALIPEARLRMNYPYRGSDDGHTTSLRRVFTSDRYVGIELEFNQAWLRTLIKEKRLTTTSKTVARAIRETVSEHFKL